MKKKIFAFFFSLFTFFFFTSLVDAAAPIHVNNLYDPLNPVVRIDFTNGFHILTDKGFFKSEYNTSKKGYYTTTQGRLLVPTHGELDYTYVSELGPSHLEISFDVDNNVVNITPFFKGFRNPAMQSFYFNPNSINLPSDDGFVRILTPRDGFSDNQVPLLSVLFDYDLPDSPEGYSIDYISISNTMEFVELLQQDEEKIAGRAKGTARVSFTWRYGKNSFKVVATNKGNGKVYESEVFTWTRYEGFIDEDGDGKDDRTNQPDASWTEGRPWDPEYDGNGAPVMGKSDNIFEFVKNVFKYLKDSVSYLSNQVKGITNIFSILTSVIPAPMLGILTLSLIVMVILKIFGR